MKKILMLIITVIVSFIFIDNVKASEIDNLTYTYKLNLTSFETKKDTPYYDSYTKVKNKMSEICGSNYDYIIGEIATSFSNLGFFSINDSGGGVGAICYSKSDNEITPFFTAFKYKNDIHFKLKYFQNSNNRNAKFVYKMNELRDIAVKNYIAPYDNFMISNESKFNRDNSVCFESNVNIIYKSVGVGNYDSIDTLKSLTINGNIYNVNDVFINNNSFVIPIKKPNLQFKEINYTLNSDKTYKTKTIDFSFDIFDLNKYRYYWSKDNVMYFDFKENQVRVTFNENTTIYFKVTDLSGNTIETYFYELNDINKTKYLDPSLDLTGKGLPSLSDSSYDDELDDNSETVNGYIERFKKYFVDKFIIIEQVQKIYEKWSSYDPYYSPDREIVTTVRCPKIGDVVYKHGGDANWCDIVWSSDYKNKIPRLHIDLSFVNIDYDFEIVDMGVLIKHRNDYFKWIYLSLGSFTFLKVLDRVIKIIRGFKHGR